MKLYIALTLILFMGPKLFSQEQTSLEKLVTVKLPSNVKRTDYSSVKIFKDTRAKSSGVDFNPRIGNFFQTSAGIIQINAKKGKPEKGRLENLEKAFKEMLARGNPKYLTSEIKSINNFKALLINYQPGSQKMGRITLYTVNDKQDIMMSGRMEYVEGNSEQALKELNDFLKGLNFR